MLIHQKWIICRFAKAVQMAYCTSILLQILQFQTIADMFVPVCLSSFFLFKCLQQRAQAMAKKLCIVIINFKFIKEKTRNCVIIVMIFLCFFLLVFALVNLNRFQTKINFVYRSKKQNESTKKTRIYVSPYIRLKCGQNVFQTK